MSGRDPNEQHRVASPLELLFDLVFVVAVIGYAIMRLALASQWLRASMQDPERRQTCLRYAVGITLVQLGWIGRIWLPDSLQVPSLILFWLCEIAVPVFAERKGNTPWHAHHIAERYALFTIIVLGEGILGTTKAVAAALSSPEYWGAIGVFGLGALALIFTIWWLYFEPEWAESLHHFRNKIGFVFGYGHFFILASLAALGSAFEVATDQIVQSIAYNHQKMDTHGAVENATETAHHALTNGYVAMCIGGAVAVFLTAYTATRWLMLDKHQKNSKKLWLAYCLAMGWLGLMVAVYHFTGFDTMWLGWVMLVAPMVMTFVCPHDFEFEA